MQKTKTNDTCIALTCSAWSLFAISFTPGVGKFVLQMTKEKDHSLRETRGKLKNVYYIILVLNLNVLRPAIGGSNLVSGS
jgi:hypothetical protein